ASGLVAARNSKSGGPSNTEPMSSRSCLMFLSVNGTARSYGLRGGIAFAAEELAGSVGVVGARDEDHEHAAVLRRDVAHLEVLEVDLRRAEDLRDPREHPGPVRDPDPDAVQLRRLGAVGERLQPLARSCGCGDRGFERLAVAALEGLFK